MSYYGVVAKIKEGSIAEEIGLQPGDKILAVNDMPVTDIIDFSFACADEEIDLLIETTDGEQELISFDKDYGEDMGILFESAVFDRISRCKNRCTFCFIEQMAPHMRKSLYVKDDDYRLSFMNGNFITLTNMTEEDYARIYRLHLSPLYVSVHTTNGQLRSEMLRNPDAAHIKEQLKELAAHNIDIHVQIVLCPDYNDKEELEKTLTDLYELRDNVLSVAIVPVGLTKHREKCYPLRTFTADEAKDIVKSITAWQAKARAELGESFVYISDEFYLMANEPFPTAEMYDGYPQIENGIGLSRSFVDEWNYYVHELVSASYDEPTTVCIVCGTSAEKVLRPLFDAVQIPNLTIRLIPVTNEFFGDKITVTGLLTGGDIMNRLLQEKDIAGGSGLLIPCTCLKAEEEIFLDDMTVTELETKLNMAVRVFDSAHALQGYLGGLNTK